MKTLNVKNLLSLSLVIIFLASSITYAAADNKAVEKAREAVENASPDDWHTLAKSAEKLLRKNTNLKEANEWIDQSLEIKVTPYNLTLKGDYYNANQLPDKALEFYVKAMKVAREENKDADLSDLQQKIAGITNIGG